MSKKAPKLDAKPTAARQSDAKSAEKLPATLLELVAGATRVVLPQPVRFVRPHARYAYFKGDEALLGAEHVVALLASGHIELLTASQPAV
ncbi:hypothetical protein FNT36_18480 [Hymenobacter setariae]|uniref:Uncharacterized protein n=1 Tax=Hymenobacter setariae TaxID=2594794 RepID=A0A558BT19_9BACT|nr:hypothetical protein [Hymenobacter setariae]TVT39629.1 hypothetical protein FNT36_18480 [Hymenobacter setariae]